MQRVLFVSFLILLAACAAGDPPYEPNDAAWHDKYAKRLYGTWADEPYYRERR